MDNQADQKLDNLGDHKQLLFVLTICRIQHIVNILFYHEINKTYYMFPGIAIIIFYFTSYNSIFLEYFLAYPSVIKAPLPFPGAITTTLSDHALISRFLFGNAYFVGLVPGGYSESNRPFSFIE